MKSTILCTELKPEKTELYACYPFPQVQLMMAHYSFEGKLDVTSATCPSQELDTCLLLLTAQDACFLRLDISSSITVCVQLCSP